MSEKKYLTEDELKSIGVDNSAKPSQGTPAGKKYLSTEELLGLGGGKVSAANKPEVNLWDTQSVSRKPAASVAPAPAAAAPKPAPRPIPIEKSEDSGDDAALMTGPSKPRVAACQKNSLTMEFSPMSDGVMSFLKMALPETINTLDGAQCENIIKSLKDGAAYQIGPQLAKGAESLLYQGSCNGYNFLVKSIRNWRDHWLGDVRTRKDVGKLNDCVSYETKMKHLNNEWTMGQQLFSEGNRIPVQMYSMRRVTRLGVELGWDLLMERINGIDLTDKRLLNVMTLADKVRVCIRMAQAIGALHLKKMIHLDIKPSNFMLDRSGAIRLIDFGISVPSGYQSRTVAGTAGYFSPEQISCRPLGEDTDVFALGIAYSVLFGGKPLAQTPEEAKSRQFRHDAIADLEKNTLSAVTDIPELNGNGRPLAEVIRACTVFRRANRISNCAVLITKLTAAAKDCGISL